MKQAVDLLLSKIVEENKAFNAFMGRMNSQIKDEGERVEEKIKAYETALAAICQHEHGHYEDEEFYSGSYDTYIVHRCKACHKVLQDMSGLR